jgi:hypothetical protein
LKIQSFIIGLPISILEFWAFRYFLQNGQSFTFGFVRGIFDLFCKYVRFILLDSLNLAKGVYILQKFRGVKVQLPQLYDLPLHPEWEQQVDEKKGRKNFFLPKFLPSPRIDEQKNLHRFLRGAKWKLEYFGDGWGKISRPLLRYG